MWPVVVDNDCCPDWASLPEAQRSRALRLATETIWALTGRQWNVCRTCVRPCESVCLSCGTGVNPPGWWGIKNPWNTYGNSGCGCGCATTGNCCKSSCAVRLDPAPVVDIFQVVVGGVVVPSDSYHVVDGNLLIKKPGTGCWPKCNDLGSPAGSPGAWSVDYSWGTVPPQTALDMAAILACELGKLCANKKCRLNGKITSLSRDGVSIELDPKAFIDVGLTGLPEVDTWIRQVNPFKLAARSEVWSPDVQRNRTVTWPSGVC